MKVIINGKKYNTETALLKAVHKVKCAISGMIIRFEFYQKFNGEYFFYKYETDEIELIEKAEIIPLNENSARSWCEQCLTVDQYEQIWGEVDE